MESVVDFHAWQVCSQITVVAAHLHASVDADGVVHAAHDVLDDLGADHATVDLCVGRECRSRHLDSHTH